MRQKVKWWLRLVVCGALGAVLGFVAYAAFMDAPRGQAVWHWFAIMSGLFFIAAWSGPYPRAPREPAEPPSILRPQRRG